MKTSKKKATSPKLNNIIDLIKMFPDEKSCREKLEYARWGGKIVCQKCGSDKKIYKINDGALYKCSVCRKQFTVRVGTIFEDSPLPLQKWFMALYLMTAHKKGISSLQLGRDIEVTQDTAWFMLHRIRFAVKTKSFNKPLRGIIEVDETYFGGAEKNKHKSKRVVHSQGRSTSSKTPIFGMLQREGELRVMPVEDVTGKTLKGIIKSSVEKSSIVISDEWKSYNNLKQYLHLRVSHGKNQYVQGIAHVNTLEGFWSLLKRGINGIYHSVSSAHLKRYCDEYSYRYNTRKITDMERFNYTLSKVEGRLTYDHLTSSGKPKEGLPPQPASS